MGLREDLVGWESLVEVSKDAFDFGVELLEVAEALAHALDAEGCLGVHKVD